SMVRHAGAGVFAGLPDPFQATRYHSLVVERESLPDCLEITAWTEDEHGNFDEIMGLRHRTLAVEGVQFHPEPILTHHGHDLLRNFLAHGRDRALAASRPTDHADHPARMPATRHRPAAKLPR